MVKFLKKQERENAKSKKTEVVVAEEVVSSEEAQTFNKDIVSRD
ncbi:MAG: hypothetical protein ACN4E2_04885 [Nitrospinota bacterium]